MVNCPAKMVTAIAINTALSTSLSTALFSFLHMLLFALKYFTHHKHRSQYFTFDASFYFLRKLLFALKQLTKFFYPESSGLFLFAICLPIMFEFRFFP